MSGLKRLVQEIHRRSIWQVLGVYLAASWGAIQVVQTLVEAAGLPDWLPGMAVALLVIGLPVVVGTAFVQEGLGGPGGPSPALEEPDTEVRSPDEGTAVPGFASRLLTWRNALLGGVGAFAVWGVVATVLLLRAGGEPAPADGEGTAPLPSIAVLPFDNMAGEENRYFADGIHEDVITSLHKAGGMKVISRTSVMGYREDRPPITEIAAALGVSVVLEGSIRRQGDEVRVTAQLIDGRDEGHLWAETYDRKVADVFAIQEQLAREIAAQLQATLATGADSALSRVPTRSAEAYDLVLRSRQAETLGEAIELAERAVIADPEYPEAWAHLSGRRSWAHQTSLDRSVENQERALLAATRALELDPDIPEGYVALARYHYRCHRDYEAALTALARASALRPGWADVLNTEGWVARRAGQWELSAEKLAQAFDVDPLGVTAPRELALTLMLLRRYDEAATVLDGLLPRAPRDLEGHVYAWLLETYRGANPRPALERLGSLDPMLAAWLGVRTGDPTRVDDLLSPSPRPVLDGPLTYVPVEVIRGNAMLLRGDDAGARVMAGVALGILDRAVDADPDDLRPYEARAVAHAILGSAGEAARDLAKLDVLAEGDAMQARSNLEVRLNVVGLLGDVEGMIETAEALAMFPGRGWSAAGLERVILRHGPPPPELVAAVGRLKREGY